MQRFIRRLHAAPRGELTAKHPMTVTGRLWYERGEGSWFDEILRELGLDEVARFVSYIKQHLFLKENVVQ